MLPEQLLGRANHDIDIALDNMTGEAFATVVNEHLARLGHETHRVAVIHANPEQSKHLETATVKILGLPIDFVNLRAEEYTESSRIPTMRFGSPREDADRRDFTMNALFYNVNEGRVEDFTGRGIEDLRAGVVRTPLPPLTTLLDDPLRVLRAVRFASRYQFVLDDVLTTAITRPEVRSALGSKVSRERVGTELDGMTLGRHPLAALRALHHLHLLPVVFTLPEPLFPNHDAVAAAAASASKGGSAARGGGRGGGASAGVPESSVGAAVGASSSSATSSSSSSTTSASTSSLSSENCFASGFTVVEIFHAMLGTLQDPTPSLAESAAPLALHLLEHRRSADDADAILAAMKARTPRARRALIVDERILDGFDSTSSSAASSAASSASSSASSSDSSSASSPPVPAEDLQAQQLPDWFGSVLTTPPATDAAREALGTTAYSEDDARLTLFASLLWPLHSSWGQFEDGKDRGKPIPAVDHILRYALKRRTKDAETTLALHKAVASLAHDAATAASSSSSSSSSPSSLSASSLSPLSREERLRLGRVLRETRDLWRVTLGLAAAVAALPRVEAAASLADPDRVVAECGIAVAEAAADWRARVRRVVEAELDGLWTRKPLLNGLELIQLGVPKGPILTQYTQKQLDWISLFPRGTAEECAAYLRDELARDPPAGK